MKKVRLINGDQFVKDFKSFHTKLVYAGTSSQFFNIKSSELWKMAHEYKINYYLSDKVFLNRRTCFIVI